MWHTVLVPSTCFCTAISQVYPNVFDLLPHRVFSYFLQNLSACCCHLSHYLSSPLEAQLINLLQSMTVSLVSLFSSSLSLYLSPTHQTGLSFFLLLPFHLCSCIHFLLISVYFIRSTVYLLLISGLLLIKLSPSSSPFSLLFFLSSSFLSSPS